MFLLECSIVVMAVYLSFYAGYSIFVTAANFALKDKGMVLTPPRTRIGVIIPAHNEELLLPRLLKSLEEQDYPSDLYDVIVVADNCSDKTSEVAHAFRTKVFERKEHERIGKGHAIKFAIECVDMNNYEALFVIDADSVLEMGALRHLDQMLKEGKSAIQCYNGIVNPDESWFTRLLNVSRAISNEIFEPGKAKLGLSSHLMGNGMCFCRETILRYGWDAFTVGEDWEYYAKLIHNDEIIGFAKHVRVYHQESASLRQATIQRMRWSSGRFAIAGNYGVALLYEGVRDLNFRKIDASLPLLFPNPSLGMNLTVLGLSGSLLLTGKFGFVLPLWFSVLTILQFGFFCIGVLYTEKKLKSLLSFFIAPVFLLWKMGIDVVSVLGLGRKTWVRTERKLE